MRPIRITIFILLFILFYPFTQIEAQTQKRTMTFLDIIQMRSIGDGDISPDGKWFIYTLTIPDWEKNKKFSDIYITPLTGDKTKKMTYTNDKNENSPKWYKDGSFFAFLADRSENKNQIYFMRPDGDEAWKVTDDEFGVSSYQWSRDWNCLAYLGGKPNEKQIWIMPGKGGKPEKLTDHKTPISSFLWNLYRKKIYFIAPDSIDLLDEERKENKFDVVIKDPIKIPSHLWEIDLETKVERRLTTGNDYSVMRYFMTISNDGTKIAFKGEMTRKYTSKRDYEVFLLNLNTNDITQITDNSVDEWDFYFSPDSKWLAFYVAEGEKESQKISIRKIYIIPLEGGKSKKLLNDFNYEGWIDFWSEDGRYFYFTVGVGVNFHLYRVSIEDDKIEQLTNLAGYTFIMKDNDSGKFFICYNNPEHPADYYYSEPENFNNREKWMSHGCKSTGKRILAWQV